MLVSLNLARTLVGIRPSCNTLNVHLHKVCFSTSLFLFVNDHTSLSFLKVFLKGLKQATPRGWSVCERKETMSKPDSIDILTISSITCKLCLFRISIWRLVRSRPWPFFKHSMKWKIELSKSHLFIHAFGCMPITTPSLQLTM